MYETLFLYLRYKFLSHLWYENVFQDHLGVPLMTRASESSADPAKWGEEEAFLRMGMFSGLSSQPYQPSECGGNHVHRKIPRYIADKKTEEKGCVKHKTASSSHTPGMKY